MDRSTHYSGADGIRGLACLIVISVHAVAIFITGSYVALVGAGKIGVWLFFVLSAFLLTSKFERSGFSMYSIGSYAVGRALRIIPLFSIVALLYYLLGTAGITTTTDLKDAILFRNGFAHLWTIPVEFKFYVFLPVIAFILIRARSFSGQAGLATTSALLILTQQLAWPYWNTPESSISTHWYLSSFTLGCYAALSMEFYRKYVTARTATVVGSLVIILMIASSPIVRNVLFGMPIDKWLMDKFVFLSFLWATFIIVLADGMGIIGGFLRSRAITLLGAWSFPIYLVHWYFYITLNSAHHDSVSWLFVGMACAIIAGACLHFIIEMPIEKFRHSLQSRFRPRLAAA